MKKIFVELTLIVMVIFYSSAVMAQRNSYGVRESAGSNRGTVKYYGQTRVDAVSSVRSPKEARIHQLGVRHGGLSNEAMRRNTENRNKYIADVVRDNPGKKVEVYVESGERGVEYEPSVEGARFFGLDDPKQIALLKENMPKWKAAERLYERSRSKKDETLLNQWSEYMQSVQGVRNRQAWDDIARADIAVIVQGLGHPLGFEGTLGKGPLIFQKAKEKNIDIITLVTAYPAQAILSLNKAGRRPLHALTVQALRESIASGLDSGEMLR